MEILWIILGLIVVTIIAVIGIYNRLVALRQNREQLPRRDRRAATLEEGLRCEDK